MAGERYMTRDHQQIREWAEARGGKPAAVIATHRDDDSGLIRLDFPDYSGSGSLEEVSWDEWFDRFDESDLVLLYQETLASGGESNFNKLISSDIAEETDDATWVGAREQESRSARGQRSRRSARSGSRARTS